MSIDIEPPWTRSKSNNVYCRLNNVPSEIRSKLKVEDNYIIKIGELSYKVRVFHDNVLIFRENPSENKRISYCKICAQNGFSHTPIRWQNSDGRWIPYNYENSTEPHAHLRQ